MSNYKTVVNPFKTPDGETFLAVEMPYELYDDIDWQAGEVLEWNVSENKDTITINRTRIIVNGRVADQGTTE